MVEINLEEISEVERAKFAGQKIRASKRRKAEPEVMIDWAQFAPMFCMPFNLILQALEVAPMTKDQEKGFAMTWGAVIDKWAPDLTEWKEEIAAGFVTVTVFGPAIKGYVEKKRKPKEGANGSGVPSGP